MTQIDFYVLDDNARGDRYHLACRIAEKARCAGRRILIHSESAEEIVHLDRLLWTYWEDRFIPHGCLGRDEPALNPILIGDATDAMDEHDVLINLADQLPSFFSRFERLIECVDHDPEVKQASRRRFKYYRDHGYPLNTHTVP
jgi:DNA polymerase-3 subunit chi